MAMSRRLGGYSVPSKDMELNSLLHQITDAHLTTSAAISCMEKVILVVFIFPSVMFDNSLQEMVIAIISKCLRYAANSTSERHMPYRYYGRCANNAQVFVRQSAFVPCCMMVDVQRKVCGITQRSKV